MNGGYDEFRRRNDEANRLAKERMRQDALERQRQIERAQDRRDEERRHRERLQTARQAGSGDYAADARSRRLSLRACIFLLLIGAVLMAVARFLPVARDEDRPEVIDNHEMALEEDVAAPETSDTGGIPPGGAEAETATQSKPISAPDHTGEDDGDGLLAATRRALASGQGEAWDRPEGRHFVAVSVPQQVGTRTCRTVAYTPPTDGATASQATWCAAGDGEWEPVK